MYPTLFHLGHLAIPTEGVLVALGLLVGLQVACALGTRVGLSADLIWNLGLISLLTLFLGARMLVIAFNLADFLAHPIWMLGLVQVRDERYFYGGAALAICAGCGYVLAWRMPWRRVADVLAAGAGVALAFESLGALAAGAAFGRPASGDWAARWGVASTSRMAALTGGTPLGVGLVALIPLYAALLHLALAAVAARLVLHAQAGRAAACWLFTAGLGTVLLGQLRSRVAGEPLVFSAFTPAQAVGIFAVVCGSLLWLQTPEVPQ